MNNQRQAVGFPVAAGLLGATALFLPACGGSDAGDGSGGGGGGGVSGTMDVVVASNGFGQLLPHTVLKINQSTGLPTSTIIPIRTDQELIDNVTTTNLIRPVPQFPTQAILPSGAEGNHFIYVQFTKPIDIDSVLSSSPGAQSNSGLTGTITLVALDPVTNTSTARNRASASREPSRERTSAGPPA
jgi:hypothetical protein